MRSSLAVAVLRPLVRRNTHSTISSVSLLRSACLGSLHCTHPFSNTRTLHTTVVTMSAQDGSVGQKLRSSSQAERFILSPELTGPLSFSLATPSTLANPSSSSTDLPPAIDCATLFITEEAAASHSLDLTPFSSLIPSSSLSITPTTWSDFTGKSKHTLFLYPSPTSSIPRVLLVGLGPSQHVTPTTFRSAVHAMITAFKHKKVKQAAINLPSLSSLPLPLLLDLIPRISVLSNHSFIKYLTKKESSPLFHSVQHLTLILPSTSPSPSTLTPLLTRARTIAESAVLTRELVNDRGDVITPSAIEAIARGLAESHGLTIRVVKGEELKEEGLTLISAVGQGSKEGEKARVIVMEYRGDDSDKERRVALVGKTVTFDTGGLNLKPTGSMEDMSMDKAGGCAVLGVMKAISQLRVKVNVIGALAVAENSIDACAIKPHAILETLKGSVEISNTDAEGRLALADTFTLVQRHYKPHTIVDIATLTGACVVALGEQLGGVFSTDDQLPRRLIEAGDRVAEELWQLPIHSSHRDSLKGVYSDTRSTGKGGKGGGACAAAAFLSRFIDEGVKWAHLDIAGPGMLSESKEWRCRGGTGFGVQLLSEFVLTEAEKVSTPPNNGTAEKAV